MCYGKLLYDDPVIGSLYGRVKNGQIQETAQQGQKCFNEAPLSACQMQMRSNLQAEAGNLV